MTVKTIFPSALFFAILFFMAEKYFKEGMKTIEETAIEEGDDIPSKAKTQLEKAIHKCNIVIDEFPESKYIDDAYYIIGKAGFYRNEYTRALKSFNILIEENLLVSTSLKFKLFK